MTNSYRFGPLVTPEGTHFRLWAPDAADLVVEIDGIGDVTMAPAGEGWQDARVDCGAGARYRFRLGDTIFPDPASRCQEGGVHGWSLVCAPAAPDMGDWRGRAWAEVVLYECHAGLMGGYAGIAAKLDSLAALGVTAIELMPIAAFPGERNWGYDGVLPFAPAEAYGTPEELRALIGRAHRLKLMMFLDVVYNHFGPDGNYLPLYAKNFFRTDTPTPWGAAIDFRVREVQDFFSENARYWIGEFGFDGLRFDAVHAIRDEGWLDRVPGLIRKAIPDRAVHLVLENEDNIAGHLRRGFNAQWNDDIHHAFHVLLTGESGGYYQDFAQAPAALLARALGEGFIYQGDPSANRKGEPRGEPSADLPATSFVAFLQNHDQIGNRAFGERLTVLSDHGALRAAVALLLLMPQIPMIYMGEEIGSRAPFLYFTHHGPELAEAVREGRRREFAAFADPKHGVEVPDPNAAKSFEDSRPAHDAPDAEAWLDLYRNLLALRAARITPHLEGVSTQSAVAIGDKAVLAAWRLGDGTRLTIASNFGDEPVAATMPPSAPIWGVPAAGAIPPNTTLAWIDAFA